MPASQMIGLHWLLARTEGFYLTTPEPSSGSRTGDYFLALAEATRDPGRRADGPGLAQAARPAARVSPTTRRSTTQSRSSRGSCPRSGRRASTSASSRWPQARRTSSTRVPRPMELIDRVNHPHFLLHMDVKAQSSEPDGTVPELIRRPCRAGRPLPRPGRQPPRPRHGRRRFPADPQGPGRFRLRPLGFRRGFRLLARRRETARQSIACLRAALKAAVH